MPKQLKNFRVRYSTREGKAHDPRDCGWFFNKLHNAKHPSKGNKCLELKQLFSREGDRAFLINLKKKATLTFVRLVLKQALDAHCTWRVEAVEIIKGKGEKFAPGERQAPGRCKATIEREAATATTAAGLSSALFVLIDGKQKAIYWYDGPTDKLIRRKREPRGAHAGHFESESLETRMATAVALASMCHAETNGAHGGSVESGGETWVLASSPWALERGLRQADNPPNGESNDSSLSENSTSITTGTSCPIGGITASRAGNADGSQPTTKHGVIPRRDTWSGTRLPTPTIDGSVGRLKRAKICEGYASDGTDSRKTPSFLTKASQRVDRMTGILHAEQEQREKQVSFACETVEGTRAGGREMTMDTSGRTKEAATVLGSLRHGRTDDMGGSSLAFETKRGPAAQASKLSNSFPRDSPLQRPTDDMGRFCLASPPIPGPTTEVARFPSSTSHDLLRHGLTDLSRVGIPPFHSDTTNRDAQRVGCVAAETRKIVSPLDVSPEPFSRALRFAGGLDANIGRG